MGGRRRCPDFSPSALSGRCETGVISHRHEGKHPREKGARRAVWRNSRAAALGREAMIAVRRLGHATLTTPDLDRQGAYCTAVVGLTLVERVGKRAFLPSQPGLAAISLGPRPPTARSRPAFQVGSGSDLAEVARELAKHGIKSERRSCMSPGVAEAVVFKDPKDAWIEIFSEYVFAKEDLSQLGIMPLKLGHVA